MSLTEAFGDDPAAVLWVDDPVVVFQCVHDLEHSAHPANGIVDGHRADELCRQVSVERQLHLKKIKHTWKHMYTDKVEASEPVRVVDELLSFKQPLSPRWRDNLKLWTELWNSVNKK